MITSFFKACSTVAVVAALTFTPAAHAQVPGYESNYSADCNCYRDVQYGPITWQDGGSPRRQVMDVWLPRGAITNLPVVFWGHSNGYDHSIEYNTNPTSEYSWLVKPVVDAGFVFVSYEFRHPIDDGNATFAPRTDIQDAINWFAGNMAQSLNIDLSNSFIAGRSRGGGLGLWTAINGVFTPPIQVKAGWFVQSQSTFLCEEMARTFIVGSQARSFYNTCAPTASPEAGSSMRTATAASLPIHLVYEDSFFRRKVQTREFGVHHPDFGLAMCNAYTLVGNPNCTTVDRIPTPEWWTGMMPFFTSKLN